VVSKAVDRDAAIRAILEYMTERNAWERAAFKQSRGRKSAAAELESETRIQAGFSELLARHCAPRVLDLHLGYHYADPPSVDPERTTIVSLSRARGTIRVRTEESNRPGLGTATYEYELADIEGVLKLSDRRRVAGRGNSIRDVW
jgi:hypothetical protein